MKQRLLYVPFIVLILLSGCLRTVVYPALSEEEHAVISAVIDSVLNWGYPEEYVPEVYNLTAKWFFSDVLRYALERDSISVDTSIYASYNIGNEKRWSLLSLYLPENVVLKSPSSEYPFTGYMDFSKPAFSDDGKYAIVEFGQTWAPLAGHGMGYLLENRDGDWVIIWSEGIWIS